MKVSVIIPLYNAEKYLPVCLESLAIQTLQDFEVIVVDDCSTDSSLAVAESYLERFDGRMKIFTLPENTGGCAVPRNVGFEHASGEYVYFADADDFLLDNALEILYAFAEDYGAEVVYIDRIFTCNEYPVPENLIEMSLDSTFSVDKPTVDTDGIAERVKGVFNARYKWTAWSKFLRRDFLVDNNITFPPIKIAEDGLWTFKIVCLAKKILRISTPLYVYRDNDNSVTRRKRSSKQDLILWTNPLTVLADYLDEFLRGLEYFRQNPDVRFKVLRLFMSFQLYKISKTLKDLPPDETYEIILREFFEAGSTHSALIAFMMANHLYQDELSKSAT